MPNRAATASARWRAAARARSLAGPGLGDQAAFEIEPGEAPALRPSGERHDPVGNPSVDQRLGADDAAGAPGTGDDDQSVGRVDEIAEAVHEFRPRAADRARDVKARIFLDRPAVEHGNPCVRAPQPVQFRGRDRRSGEFVLDDFREPFARNVGARKQRMAGCRPSCGAAGQNVEAVVAEPREASRGLCGDAVHVVQQHYPARPSRHETGDFGLQPAVGQVYREKRVTRTVLTLLAYVE